MTYINKDYACLEHGFIVIPKGYSCWSCDTCGKPFIRKARSGDKYCCESCRVADNPQLFFSKFCEHCGGVFLTKARDKSYCSSACKSRAKRKRGRVNKKYIRARHYSSVAQKKEYVWLYKKNNPCSECGESRPEVLQFHHEDQSEKLFNISGGFHKQLNEIKEEIKKCVVLCANCHSSLHYWQNH